MLKDYRAIREVSDAIADECSEVIRGYRKSRFVDEPHITDRLMGAIETRVRTMSFGPSAFTIYSGGYLKPIRWQAMTLRAGPGSAAHEKKYGADILCVFEANLPKYKVTKGFLAQAKRAEPGHPFSKVEWDRLVDQCHRMLSITPDAYVVAYSKKEGVKFFSALAVSSLGERDMFALYSMTPRAFFERHFQSFIGDKRLDQAAISVLDGLNAPVNADERPSSHVLKLSAE